MIQPIIIFRVDSSTSIGSGHVMRCLALADGLRHKANIHFICKDLPGNLSYLVKKQSFQCHLFSKTDDSAATIGYIQSLKNKPTWLVLDHYGLSEDWEHIVRDKIENLLVIEDMPTRKHECDAILVQNALGDQKKEYIHLVPSHCQNFMGPMYALLRSDFKTFRNRHIFRKKPKTLFIFFSGTDPTSETLKTLASIRTLTTLFDHTHVVIGSQSPDVEKIKNLTKNETKIQLHIQTDKMAEIMADSDLALGAGGFSVFERFCIGLPSLSISVAINQLEVLKRFDQDGLLTYLGESSMITEKDILLSVEGALKNWTTLIKRAKKSMTIVDGNGTERVVQALLEKEKT